MADGVILQVITSFVNGLVCMLFCVYGVFFIGTKRDRLKRILGCIMLGWAILLSKDVLYFFIDPIERLYEYRLMLIIDNSMVVACGIFALELLKPRNVTIGKFLMHISGFLLLFLLYAFTGRHLFFMINEMYTYLYCMVIFVWLIANTIRYNRMVRSLYSDLSNVDVSWLWIVVILMLCVLFIWQFLYGRVDNMLDILYYVVLATVWSIIFFKTNNMIVPEKEDIDSVESVSNGEERCDAGKYDYMRARLKQLEDSGYFISSPQLTLKELADVIGTNRTYLSEFLNAELGVTFYDYVNGVRLEYAERLLRSDDRKMTLEDVAMRSGFNSLSTFRRAFQKRYGASPTEYRRGMD